MAKAITIRLRAAAPRHAEHSEASSETGQSVNMRAVDECAEIEAIVDRRIMLTRVPRAVLERLRIRPTDKRQFRTVDGNLIERDIGLAKIEVPGESAASVPVIFAEENERAVLGVTALLTLGLDIDPSTGELRPAELLMFASRAA